MEFYSILAKVYLLDKTKPWFGFGDLGPFFKVTGEFSLKTCFDQWVDFTQAKGVIRPLYPVISFLRSRTVP